MSTLRDAKYREKQVITDKAGNEVDLSNIAHNFSPMVDPETGEEVTNPNLQFYMEHPEYADFEAADALVREGPGQTTNLQQPLNETKPLIFKEDPMQKGTPEQQTAYNSKVAQASQALQNYGAGQQSTSGPAFQPIPGIDLGERERFKQMVIQEHFGGRNPYTFDPLEEVEKLPASHFQHAYEKMQSATMGPMWWDLSDQQRLAFYKDERSKMYERLKAATDMKIAEMKDIMGDYDLMAAKREKEQEKFQTRVEKIAKVQREAQEREAKRKKERTDRKLDLYSKALEVQQKIDGAYQNQDTTSLKEQAKTIKDALGKLIAEEKDEQARQQALRQGATPQVKPGPRTKGFPPQAVAMQYLAMTGGNRQLALQMMEDDGYDTTPPEQKVQQ